ncbi:uncharacterized protein LOC122055557 [Zingiber officinale]|uniref:uncharacterized protein LOC122055557 n=1 Tax=Zingiber officinale TaxID=94328 RepID=UPI001C4BFE65|nr:uncharacterized protein LOC122055557 [Zingiber officinale]
MKSDTEGGCSGVGSSLPSTCFFKASAGSRRSPTPIPVACSCLLAGRSSFLRSILHGKYGAPTPEAALAPPRPYIFLATRALRKWLFCKGPPFLPRFWVGSVTFPAMKKVATNEQDTYNLSQRYDLSMLLTLMQEVYEVADAAVKIDWNALVEKTATGITNAREYQMLWRYLAYRHPLLDKIEEGAEPLDDDSDLEIELEIVPPVIEEASCQANELAEILLGLREKTDLNAPLAEKGVDKEMLDAAPDKQPPQTSHAVASSSLQKKLSQPTGAPIVSGVESGLDEAAEGVVGDVQDLVSKKRRLGDGEDETPVD